VLAASHVSFSYGPGSGPVLDDVTVEVAHRDVVGILGPNGSGKTTLLKLLAGSLAPTSGRVTLDGRPLHQIPRRDLAKRVAVVPQETHLAFDYTVLEIALMGRYPWLGAFEIEGPSDLAAATDALETCTSEGNSGCELVLTFQNCGAYAASKVVFGTGAAATQSDAEKRALTDCGDKDCKIVISDCE